MSGITINSQEVLGKGKFIQIEQIKYTDELGKDRIWEKCSRVNSRGAVIIIPHIMPDDEYILVRQFRIPTNKYVIEFPAGLIDGDDSFESTAIREMYEETGYEGVIDKIYPSGFSSPGMSSEESVIVKMTIDGDFYRGKVVENHQEESENIEVLRVKRANFENFLMEAIAKGDGVDNKLFMLL